MTKAKDKAKAPATAAPAAPVEAEEAEAAPAQVDGVAESDAPAVETDPRKRFRAALDRKNATPGTHPGSMAEGNKDLKSSNGKRQRQFRRKSGG